MLMGTRAQGEKSEAGGGSRPGMWEEAGDGGRDGFFVGSEEDTKLLGPKTVPDPQ